MSLAFFFISRLRVGCLKKRLSFALYILLHTVSLVKPDGYMAVF